MKTPASSQYHLVCGLEIHAELATASKMFCSCPNDPFHAPQPNCYTCPSCLGMPGGLPVANKKAIEWTIMTGLALGCTINQFSKFDRKHYFYPDLPKGYQISQFDIPFCEHGVLETSFGPVAIRRIHLEEDTGKLVHTTVDGKEVSLVDFNRSSVPLMELVTGPEIATPAQAKEFGKKLRQLLRYLGVADCDMEQGGMRLEANISLQTPQQKKDGVLPSYKVEVKNINSFRFLEQAITFEITRQQKVLESGEVPVQETRGFDSKKGVTFSQRTKEDAADYRYFPEPDIPPIQISDEHLQQIKSQTPELPAALMKRWETQWQVAPSAINVLSEEPELAHWADALFTEASSHKLEPKTVANTLANKKISYTVGEDAQSILKKISSATQAVAVDTSALQQHIQAILSEQADAVTRYKAGETKVLGFLIGQLMRKLPKGSDPKQAQQQLIEAL